MRWRRSGGSGARRRRPDAPAGPARARNRPGARLFEDEMSRARRPPDGDRALAPAPERKVGRVSRDVTCATTASTARSRARSVGRSACRHGTSVRKPLRRQARSRKSGRGGGSRRRPVASRGSRGAALAALPAPDRLQRRAGRAARESAVPRIPADPFSDGRSHVPSQPQSDCGRNPSRAGPDDGRVRRSAPPASPHRAAGRSSSGRAHLHRRRGTPRRDHPTGRPR